MSTRAAIGEVDIARAIRRLGLADRPVEVHVSLRSFGGLESGATTIVDGMLAAGSTVLAATMAPDLFGIPAPPDDRPAQNGVDYAIQEADAAASPWAGQSNIYDTGRTEVSDWLGGFSAHVAARPDRIRCKFASGEFAAVGPLAPRLIGAETQDDVFGPLRALASEDGAVVLMGVGLTRMTLLHLAEVEAGRRPFIRWGRDANGGAVRVRAGECSDGFESFASVLATIERRRTIGRSQWRVFPAAPAVELAAAAIRRDPHITQCPNADCIECADAIAGGPLE